MHRAGADLMVSKSVSRQTRGARNTDRAESMSVIQTIVDSLERMLENTYELAGKWIGVDASDVVVNIAPAFDLDDDPNPIDSLLKLNLSDKDMLAEAKRRGLVAETVDEINPQPEEATPQPNNNELGNDEN